MLKKTRTSYLGFVVEKIGWTLGVGPAFFIPDDAGARWWRRLGDLRVYQEFSPSSAIPQKYYPTVYPDEQSAVEAVLIEIRRRKESLERREQEALDWLTDHNG